MANNAKIQASISLSTEELKRGVAESKAALAELPKEMAVQAMRVAKNHEAIVKGAKEAGVSVTEYVSKLASANQEADKAAKQQERASNTIVAAIQRQTIAMKAGGKVTADYFEQIAKMKGADPKIYTPVLEELRKVEAAQKAIAEAQKVTANTFATSGRQLDQFGNTAKQTAAALRQVPAQFTDIVVSLQGGQAPLTVLLQQGGQLRDIFGSAGAAASALGKYVVGLVNPFTTLVAILGSVAYGYAAGSKEADEYRKALILTGNATGTTAGQMTDMARALSQVAGTQGNAAEALVTFVSTARVSAENLQKFTLAAVQFERSTGTAVGEIAKQFADLRKDPLEATLKLNESMNYLTKSTYEQIKALTEQGKATEAADLAQSTFADTLKNRAGEIDANLGVIEKAWKKIKGEIAGAADSLKNIGRPDTGAAELERVRNMLATKRESLGAVDQGSQAAKSLKDEIALLVQRESVIQRTMADVRRGAAMQAAETDAVKARAEWDKDGLKLMTDKQKLEREIIKIREEGLRARASEEEIERRIKKVREDYANKQAAGGASEIAQLKARSEELDKYAKSLEDYGTDARKITEDEKTRNRIQQELAGTMSDTARAQKTVALAQAEINAQKAITIRMAEDEAKIAKSMAEDYAKSVSELFKSADAIKAQADAQEAANASFGKSKTAIAEHTLEQKKNRLEMLDRIGLTGAYTDALRAETIEQERLVDALKAGDYKEINQNTQEILRAAREQSKLYEQELQLSGLTALEREKIVATRQVELKYAKEIDKINRSGLTDDQKQKQIAILDQAKVTETSAAVNRVIQNDFAKTADQINQSLTDALMRGFESGKSFADVFKDTLENMFKTMVLRPTIEAILSPVSGALSSVVGGSGGSGIKDAVSLGSSIKTLGSLLETGVSASIANGFAKLSASSFGQSIGLSTPTVDSVGTLSNTPTALSGKIGSGLGIAGNALAGYGLQKTISGGYKTGESGLVDALTVAASAYFGPIAGVVGGLVNRAFGRKVADSGIQGTFGGEAGFSGSNFVFEKGGWFRSNRTRTTAMDEGLQSGLSTQFKTMQAQTALMADVLGLGTDSIRNFTSSVKLSLQGLSAEEVTSKLTETLTGIGESLAKTALGTTNYSRIGETSVETLTRLSGSLMTVNETFKILGESLYSTSLAGADMASQLVDLFGGMDQFKAITSSYYENFFSESERAANSIKLVSSAIGALGLNMPKTREEFRILVDAQDLTTDSGRKVYTALLQLSGAFAEVVPASTQAAAAVEQAADVMTAAMKSLKDEQAQLEIDLLMAQGRTSQAVSAQRAKDIAGLTQAEIAAYDYNQALKAQIKTIEQAAAVSKERTSLEEQLFRIQGNTVALRARERESLDATNRALYDQIAALEDAKAVADERISLEGQLLQASGNVAAIRAKELASLNSANRSIQERIYALEDEQKRTEERKNLEMQLLQAMGDTASIRALEIQTLDVSNRALQERLWALEDERKAQEALAAASTGVIDEIERLRQTAATNGQGESAAFLQAQFATTTAQARAGDLSALAKLPTISSALEEAFKLTARTSSEVMGIRMFLAGSLAETLATVGVNTSASASVAAQAASVDLSTEADSLSLTPTNSAALLAGSSDTAALIEEISALRIDNQAQARAIVQLQSRFTKVIERWDSDGLPEQRAVA